MFNFCAILSNVLSFLSFKSEDIYLFFEYSLVQNNEISQETSKGGPILSPAFGSKITINPPMIVGPWLSGYVKRNPRQKVRHALI